MRLNKESQHLQYAVAERVRALGWKQVEIIDGHLGLSAGIASARREGFERVLSSVALGEVGIVGSRCRLLEVCQIFGTLIADEQHRCGHCGRKLHVRYWVAVAPMRATSAMEITTMVGNIVLALVVAW